MALACQLPIKSFLDKLEKYEASMKPIVSRGSFRSVHHKAKCAISITEEVNKLRALIAAASPDRCESYQYQLVASNAFFVSPSASFLWEDLHGIQANLVKT